MPKLNVNTATVAELAALPGIGPSLAQRIVEYRETVGLFRTIYEIAAVKGVSEALITRIRHLITVDPGSPGSNTGEKFILTVRLKSDGVEPERYDDHGVSVKYVRVETISDPEGNVTYLSIPEESVKKVDEDAEAVFELPEKEDLEGEVLISALAPDGELLKDKTYPSADLPEEVSINVKPRDYFAVEPNEDPNFGKSPKLRGRVIEALDRQEIEFTQVVIWGATKDEPQEQDFRALIVADTDEKGYFSGPLPRGVFTAAYGVVAVGDGVTVPLHLLDDQTFPENVILVVNLDEVPLPEPGEEDDCECHKKPPAVPRDPDSTELTRADGTYSQDLGKGGCIDFTRPDRTLDEFTYSYVVRTTEPSIKGMTLEEPDKISANLLLNLLPAELRSATFTAKNEFSTASRVAANKPQEFTGLAVEKIDAKILRTLANDPDGFSLTKLTTAANRTLHADILRLVGKHLRFAPQRTRLDCKNAVDWDDEPTIYQACTIAHGHVLRFKQEWIADGYSLGNLLHSIPLAPGQKKQIAIVDWERRETAARQESLSESEQLDAFISRDRDIHEIVNATVAESTRGGSSAKTGSFGGGIGIGAILGPVGGLLGIGGGSSKASSSAWQNSSRKTAADSLQMLRDRTIQGASSIRNQRSTVVQTVRQGERVTAQTESLANYNHCHAITIQYFEVLRHLLVRQRLTDVQECLFVPLLMTRFNRDKALRWRNTLQRSVFGRLRTGFAALERIENNYVGSDLPVGTYADQTIDNIDGDLYLRFELARPKDVDDAFHAASWGFLSFLLPHIDAKQFYDNHLKEQALKDQIFFRELGPRIAERFVQNLDVFAVDNNNVEHRLNLDPTLVSDFVNDSRMYVSLRMSDALSPIARKDIKFIKISNRSISLGGLLLFNALPANSKVIVESGSLRYQTKYSSDYLFRNSRIYNDLTATDDVRIFTPLNRQEIRNPREEDKELARQLLDHLNEHLEFYHHRIWWAMSADRRYMLLDGFIAPNSSNKSVASVVENELIGIVGNSLILPVSRGYHLDPTFKQDVENPIDLLEHYAPNTPIEPTRMAIPTRGVYAEAVMGACNSCEFKEEERFWRWEESPIPDSPAAISPISTESRRAEVPDLTAKDFPAPIINMQTAPNAPDPTGLAAALQLIGQPNLFKDITGLTGNQQNAIAALNSAMETAKFFGGQAANLAIQGRMSRDVDKAMRTIQNAKQNGLISDEQAKELTANAIRGMIGGGSEKKEPALTREPQVEKAISNSTQRGEKVKIQRGSESVELGEKGEGEALESFDFNVPGIVPIIAQPSNLTCWATVSTMMVSWKDSVSYPITEVMDMAGATYRTKFDNNQGLLGSEKPAFLAALGFTGEPPQSYSVQGFRDLLESAGPLWATTDELPGDGFAIHARIVTGMFGNGTPEGTFLRINDPAGGRQYSETFLKFMQKFEEVAAGGLRVQIVHF